MCGDQCIVYRIKTSKLLHAASGAGLLNYSAFVWVGPLRYVVFMLCGIDLGICLCVQLPRGTLRSPSRCST